MGKQSRIARTKETRGGGWTYVLEVKKVGLSRKKSIENQKRVNGLGSKAEDQFVIFLFVCFLHC